MHRTVQQRTGTANIHIFCQFSLSRSRLEFDAPAEATIAPTSERSVELRVVGVASSSLGSGVDLSGLFDDDDDFDVDETRLKLGYVNVLEFVSGVTIQISSYG